MANHFHNQGSGAAAENMRDMYNFSIYNAPPACELDQVSLNVPRTEILFKPITKPHADFTGRIEFVNSAIKVLNQPVAADVQIQFPCLVIHALGGYGKTQTARKIGSVCSKKRIFQHFMWIDSEVDVSIKRCFVSLGQQIGLESPNFDSLLHRFYSLLVGWKHEKFLIIFDNVEDFDKILNYFPLDYPASNISVLMTSQRPFTKRCYGNVTNQRLDLLLQEEAMELVESILGRRSTDSEQDKKLLVEQSGSITLVLCVMASTIKFQRKYESDYKIKDYLEEMSNQPIQYRDKDKDLDLNYDKSLQTIVLFAVDKLGAVCGPIGKIAVKFFDRLAYCSSTNRLDECFVNGYLRDICEKVNNVVIKLPIKPASDLQILRMAIEKLSEFSLVQLSGSETFSVHRWIQASRRLNLKDSGNERNTLKELLFIMPQPHDLFNIENTSIIWEHVSDYADLVDEFYAQKGTLKELPIGNIGVLEKIIRGLMKSANLKKFENFPDHVHDFIIEEFMVRSFNFDNLKRVVNAFDFYLSQKSAEFISVAIRSIRLDVVKWLVNEKSCAPQKFHLQCFWYFEYFEDSLQKLHPLNIDLGEIIQKNPGENLLDCLLIYALNKLESMHVSWTSHCIESYKIKAILCALEYFGPSQADYVFESEMNLDDYGIEEGIRSTLPVLYGKLKIGFAEIIEQNPGKSLLECLFH